MKDLFSWRLPLSDSDFVKLWENAIFVFDTNFLLDLYRVSRPASEDFLQLLEHLKDRIWLPYQVVDEFLNRRENVIASETASFAKALSSLEEWKNEQLNFRKLRELIDNSGRIIAAEVKCLFSNQDAYTSAICEVEKCFKEKIEEVNKTHSVLNSEEDYILEKILILFDKRVGNSYEITALQKLYKEGEDRYKQEKPPGFKDIKKEGMQKYGDFILWKQILDFAKAKSCPIILVTRDSKDDWWNKKEGKIVSPHLELRREFHEQVQQPFWMYQTQRFYEIAKDKLGVELNPRSIEEANAVAEEKAAEETAYEESLQAIQQIQNSPIIKDRIEELLRRPEISKDRIEELLRRPEISKDRIEELLRRPEISKDRIEELLRRPEISKDRIEELLRRPEISEDLLKIFKIN